MSRNYDLIADVDNVADESVALDDRGVRLLLRLTKTGSWEAPASARKTIPSRLAAFIATLDPATDTRAFGRAVKLMTRLHEQNMARDRQEIQLLAPSLYVYRGFESD